MCSCNLSCFAFGCCVANNERNYLALLSAEGWLLASHVTCPGWVEKWRESETSCLVIIYIVICSVHNKMWCLIHSCRSLSSRGKLSLQPRCSLSHYLMVSHVHNFLKCLIFLMFIVLTLHRMLHCVLLFIPVDTKHRVDQA